MYLLRKSIHQSSPSIFAYTSAQQTLYHRRQTPHQRNIWLALIDTSCEAERHGLRQKVSAQGSRRCQPSPSRCCRSRALRTLLGHGQQINMVKPIESKNRFISLKVRMGMLRVEIETRILQASTSSAIELLPSLASVCKTCMSTFEFLERSGQGQNFATGMNLVSDKSGIRRHLYLHSNQRVATRIGHHCSTQCNYP